MCIYTPYRYTKCICTTASGSGIVRCFRAIRTEQACPNPTIGHEEKRIGTCWRCEGVGQAVAGAEKEREKGRKGKR